MRKKIMAMLSLILAFSIIFAPEARASESTAYTYTMSVNNEWIRTLDAYMPGTVYFYDGTLLSPEDLFYYDGKLYIADTGNGRIVIYDLETNSVIGTVGEGTLVGPTGIFVTGDGIYAADKGSETVYGISHEGEILLEIKRPDSYLFSDVSQFIPSKVAVTSQGVIFVCGEGAYEGLMQFDKSGEFQGYYAANTAKISFTERIEELFFTEEQMETLLTRTPAPIYNLDISDRDLVYSITQLEANTAWSVVSKTENAVKYHNMAGNDILSKTEIEDEANFTDIASYENGISFAVSSSGIIYEYDENGDVIFSFGGRDTSNRNGLFTSASAIDVSEDGVIYVLDRERGYIQAFFPTDFAISTHTALNNIRTGNYSQSEDIWLELLKLNGMSLVAHSGYGKSLYQQQRFEEAAEQFKIVNDKHYYSECMWELRNQWLQNNLIYIISAAAILLVLLYARRLLIKKGILKKRNNKCIQRLSRPFKVQWSYVAAMIRHPIDELYYIKRGWHASVKSATVIYIAAFAVYVSDMFFRSFTFSVIDTDNTSPLPIVVMFIVPLILWVIGNSMVSAINEGEGSFKNVYVSTAYAFSPYLVFAPIIIIATYVFTLNEAFLIHFSWAVIILWTAFLLCMSLKEIHNYTVKESVKVIFITLFFMVMAVIVCVIVFLILQQVVTFIEDLYNEVTYRV